jgi:peptide/nickel transport system permease protein
MKRYFLRRLLLGILCIIGVSIIIFVATRLSGDVTVLLLPGDASQEDYDNLRAQLGLDKPLPVQYLVFLKNVAKGDFGKSTRYNRPATEIVFSRLPATIQLASAAFLISSVIGILVGVASATRRGSLLDKFGIMFALLGQSVPEFWIGIMAILVFAVQLRLLPTSGYGGIKHLILPACTLGWFCTAVLMRLTRSSMLDVMDCEYVKMAKLKGNPEWVVVWKHAVRNALIPVVTMGGLQLARLLGGAVIIENVFVWPGLGKLVIDAVFHRDYAVVQACVFLTSLFYISLNLAVDSLYGLIDPQIRYE